MIRLKFNLIHIVTTLFFLVCLPSCAHLDYEDSKKVESATIEMPSIWSDNAVVQANRPVKVWGKTGASVVVTVSLAGTTRETKSDHTGRFRVELAPHHIDRLNHTMEISTDSGATHVINNILFGEVWIAAGQSNMEWQLENSIGGQDEALYTRDSEMRLFQVERRQKLIPGGDVKGKWRIVEPLKTRKFSAVGFHFGRTLRRKLDKPVGIIQTAYGGTRAEAWVPESTLINNSTFDKVSRELTDLRDQEKKVRTQWMLDTTEWIKQVSVSEILTKNPPRWNYQTPSKQAPSALFNGMVDPIVPYSIRGVIWYQGESNRENANNYSTILRGLISGWRNEWNYELPFGIVQIASLSRYPEFAIIQKAQEEVSRDPGNGLVVINDVGHLDDIHPRNKRPVGERLAYWALSDVYNYSDNLETATP